MQLTQVTEDSTAEGAVAVEYTTGRAGTVKVGVGVLCCCCTITGAGAATAALASCTAARPCRPKAVIVVTPAAVTKTINARDTTSTLVSLILIALL